MAVEIDIIRRDNMQKAYMPREAQRLSGMNADEA